MPRTKIKTVREILEEIQRILNYNYYDGRKFQLIYEVIVDSSEEKSTQECADLRRESE